MTSCKYCGCKVYYDKNTKKFYESPNQPHDYETRCKVFQKTRQFKKEQTIKQEIDTVKLGYTEEQIELAKSKIDDKLNSVIFTIDYVTKRLKEVGIANPNPQLVGMITKIIREESRE